MERPSAGNGDADAHSAAFRSRLATSMVEAAGGLARMWAAAGPEVATLGAALSTPLCDASAGPGPSVDADAAGGAAGLLSDASDIGRWGLLHLRIRTANS